MLPFDARWNKICIAKDILVDNIEVKERRLKHQMKSICIKTNNIEILDYLLNRISNEDFENLAYTKKQFKIYNNIIIHYQGKENSKFIKFLSNVIEEAIIIFYQEKIMKQLINYNYFYFDEYEKNKILENCIGLLDTEEYIEKIEEEQYIKEEVRKYLVENKSIILDGFVYFRLKEYFKVLDYIVDSAVNQFVIEREYTEFIDLLKIYVNSKLPSQETIHLIYVNGESILLDEQKNIVSVSENIYNAQYLSDITFSSNDFALNTLLSLLPNKIEIHLISEEDEFINTIKLIFEDRVSLCTDCNICKTYRMLNSAKFIH